MYIITCPPVSLENWVWSSGNKFSNSLSLSSVGGNRTPAPTSNASLHTYVSKYKYK